MLTCLRSLPTLSNLTLPFANAKSVLGLLAARVQQGDEIEVVCDGVDEKEALHAIVKVIQEDMNLEQQ